MSALGRAAAIGLASLAALLSARPALAQCQGRPTDPAGFQGYSYGAATVSSYATAHVRVHYATSGPHAPTLASTRGDGVPDTVAFAGDTAEDALTRYGQMGFKAPPSDASCTSNGGDDKLDVYLVAFAGADGTTIGDACNGRVCASFVLCEATFAGRGYADAEEGFKTVISHELFHAVQNAYDHDLDRFWAEGSAQWAMKTLHPELQDFERQLPAFFAEPSRSIDTAPSGVTAGYLYGSAVWPLFLSLTSGQDAVRAILEAEADGTKAVAATDAVLKARGSSLADAFPTFAAWNVATGKRAGDGGYPDAAKYPGVKLAGALEDGTTGITSGLGSFAYSAHFDAPTTITVDTDPARNGAVVVPLEGGKARVGAIAKLPADAEGDAIVVVAGVTSKKTDAPFTIHLAPAGAGDAGADAAPAASGGGDGGGCAIARRRDASGSSGAVAWLAIAAGLAVARKRRA